MILLATLVIAAVLLFAAAVIAAALIRNPDLHVWPSVTRCRICEKRVFVWQRQEFRLYAVRLDDPDGLLAGRPDRISASGIVHRRCKGTPSVTLSVRSRPAARGHG